MKKPEKKQIRPSLVSGLFYPDRKEELTLQLDQSLLHFKENSSDLILTPHGSYSTNGACMAAAFSACRKKDVQTVLLLGPVHREKNNAFLYLPEKEYFETPLGYAHVNTELRNKLNDSSSLFVIDNSPHMEEHCLEVQLPYVRHLFPDAEILPILMGKLNRKQIRKAAEEMKAALSDQKESILTVLSVNLSDFLPLDESEKMASHLIELMQFPLEHSLLEEEKKGNLSTCGTTVLTLASELFPEAGKAHLLYHEHTRVSEHGMDKGVYYGGFCWKRG
ncbi:MAG: AmmeMemoRadiSam system protein B [Spirochaetaceae bacterium 4572_59]|nr:MAG: AmmeMemoRadiSam system protein B [Spirochaetaceae bacterium 4572_59]